MAEPIVSVALEPRDGTFLKDGRGWFTSESNRAGTLVWPFGTTVRGAVRAALGHAVEADRRSSLGQKDWLPLNEDVEVSAVLPLARRVGDEGSWACTSRLWPAPLDTTLLDGQANVVGLEPVAAPASILSLDDADESAAIAAMLHPRHAAGLAKPLPMPRFWSDASFIAWLCGKAPERHAIEHTPQPGVRTQTHVCINRETGTADEGKLFSGGVVEPHTRGSDGNLLQWSFAAVSHTLGGLRAGRLDGRVVRLGADGRTAVCQLLPESLFAIPADLEQAFTAGSRGMRLVLVGPASFDSGWRPASLAVRNGRFIGRFAGLDDVVVHGACVGRPEHVSGWDVANGSPKSTRRLAPAGSVYFLSKRSGEPFSAADARAVWLASVGEPIHRPDRLGAVVPGIWNPSNDLLHHHGELSS